MTQARVFLMYHEIEVPGRALCDSDPGYVRYAVREDDFRQQVSWLKQQNILGLSVDQGLASDASDGVVFTFDDGCATDLTLAAPVLHEAGFSATFYITLGFLGRPGYMSREQVRQLSEQGLDVGCHSMSHPYLSDLSRPELQHEIADAKTELEQITGRPVHHFSCPGGRWSALAAEVAKEAGYRTVASSRIGVNRTTTDPFNLARVAIMRGTPLTQFQHICRAEGLWQLQLRDLTRSTAKQLLGNRLYDRLRSSALEH
jgi:peptidoglycan/xylan/chitin deacetylase (PgdA/CDA1 family)